LKAGGRNTDEKLKEEIFEILRSEEVRSLIRAIIADYEEEKKLEKY
jgi:sulfite reductase beta subunit-like hemoprotein